MIAVEAFQETLALNENWNLEEGPTKENNDKYS